ncbi:hypothetical protein LguiB_013248 [Lonicera macranthoides]
MASSHPPTKPLVLQAIRGGYRKFQSHQEFEWWNYAFKSRTVVIERLVYIGTLNDFPQRATFERNPGWINYLREQGNQCNITICCKFAASLIQVPNTLYTYIAHVCGKTLHFNLEVLSEITGIPALPHNAHDLPNSDGTNYVEPPTNDLASFLAGRPMEWIGTQFDKSNLHDSLRMLWLVIANALDPTSHIQHLYPSQAYVLYAIATNKHCYLLRHIIGQITRIIDLVAHNETIKFGSLITRVCFRAGVHEKDEDEKEMPRAPLNWSTQTRASDQLRNRPSSSTAAPRPGDEEEDGAEEAGADVPGPLRRRRRASSGPVDDNREFMREHFKQMNALMQTGFASINERVEIMVLCQDHSEADIAAQVEARVEARMAAQMVAQQEFIR